MTKKIPKANLPMPVWATLLLGLIFIVLAGPGLAPKGFPSLAAAFPAFAQPASGVACLSLGFLFASTSVYLLRRFGNEHRVKHGLPAIELTRWQAIPLIAAPVLIVLAVLVKKFYG